MSKKIKHPRDRKIKIAILCEYSLDPTKIEGGSLVHIYDLVNYLRKYVDLDLHIVTRSTEVRQDTIKKYEGTTIYYLSSPRLPGFITSLTIDRYKVLRKIKEIKPDIINAHSTAPLYGVPASLLQKNYPILLTVHGIVNEERKSWRGLSGFIKGVVYGHLEKKVLKNIKTILVDTPYVAHNIKPYCRGEIHVIPLGIEKYWFELKNREVDNRLLFVGGIEPRKGLLYLLKAIRIIKEKGIKVELHIVGGVRKKPYFKELNKYVKNNKLEKNVNFLGFLTKDEIKKEYEECSIFVLPSQEESQGLVLLEAMAACKPVVATNRGGIPYIVKNNSTGFLVEYGNAKELADRIIKLLGDKKLRRGMGERGKKKAKEFTSERNAEKVYDLLYTKIALEE